MSIRTRLDKLPAVGVLLCTVFYVLSGITTGCTGVPERTGESMMKTELYFGMSRRDTVPVTSAEWQAFVDTCITREFAQGFTVATVYGQWRDDRSGIVREDSKILIVVHPDTEATERSIELIRATYKNAFRQESVLRVTSPVRASF